ncbi:EAL domain-containing protein [Qipengyuania algicida]|uniref:EAL domain-containing protein n=1 Tax=Qipengyuania algicida TaxID=1836209 RepID=UPI0019276CF2|nr:EAL domain-containing protein [Qipengyuania algicida]
MGFFSRVAAETSERFVATTPRARDDLALRVELLESFEGLGLGCFWATDGKGQLNYISGSALSEAGWASEAVLGKPLNEIFESDSGESSRKAQRTLPFLLAANASINALPVKLRNTDKQVWWEISGKAYFNPNGEFTGYRGSAKDITEAREMQLSAERLAHFDSLTGLANRHRLESQLSTRLTAYRDAKRACAVMMLDLDRFKQVNDTLGHPAGDELLKQVAMRLQTVLEKRGTIGRLGGDEFLVILPDMEDRGDLGELAQRVIQMISQPYSLGGDRAVIGTSVGIATAPYDGIDSGALISAADMALYAAKGGGRGHYRFYSADLKVGAQMRRQIEEDLRDALAKGELEMNYQPIIASATHKVTCMESLIRWNHSERGMVPPQTFIPIAEDLGLIHQLGEWILQRCCKEAALWKVPLRVAVNVSALQFGRDDFCELVARTLRSTGLAAERLELELTESVFLADAERTHAMFEELKRLGVRLALDDFGTGYSSLSYLQRAPFDKIKIDRSFVRGATEAGNNNPQILSAIVNLAEALGMETVAEGVETLDELELVKSRGASHVQGFIFSPAMSQTDVMKRLDKEHIEFEAKGPPRFRADRRSQFRRVGVIHDDCRYKAVLKNLSKTGAAIEGLLDVPVGTELVLDLGAGQLAVCVVRRSKGAFQGLEFETPLVSDGADGLCTRHRVSPYAIEAAGRPLAALSQDAYSQLAGPMASMKRQFVEVQNTDRSAGRFGDAINAPAAEEFCDETLVQK